MKICTIVGARPQFIKAAVVSRRAAALSGVTEILVHTGQHYDDNMSAVFFTELGIPEPAYSLGIGSSSHGAQTGRMLEAVEGVILAEHPEWVLVYGDTNSTIAGALAAVKLHVPVAHVEAGLRSFNRRMPEEINRVLTDHCANLLFAPTDAAVANLHREGIPEGAVRKVGDVMYDAALHYGEKARRESAVLSRLGLTPGGFALATIHRAENTDDPARLDGIMKGLAGAGLPVVLPLHPRTRKVLGEAGLLRAASSGIRILEPVGYLDMAMLEASAKVIATDSGGIQKEAFFHGVPCVTLRDETEWVELVEAGWNVCVGADASRIASALAGAARPSAPPPPLYGDGDAAGKILSALREFPG